MARPKKNNRYKNKRCPTPKKKVTGSESKQESRKASLLKKVVESKERFLNAFLEAEGNISLAAEEAGIDRSTHYGWMEKDQEYATKFIIFQEALNEQEKRLFLAAYINVAKSGKMSIAKAAEMIGIDRGKHYEWLKDDKYVQQFRKTQEQLGDVLEEEAFSRAVEGWDEPVFYEGAICGHIRKKSDSLLTKLLMAFKPDKYREKQAEINIRNSINIPLADAVGAARERLRNVQERDITSRIGAGE